MDLIERLRRAAVEAMERYRVPGMALGLIVSGEEHTICLGTTSVELLTIAEVQDWIRQRAKALPKGTWIRVPRTDITRSRGHSITENLKRTTLFTN